MRACFTWIFCTFSFKYFQFRIFRQLPISKVRSDCFVHNPSLVVVSSPVGRSKFNLQLGLLQLTRLSNLISLPSAEKVLLDTIMGKTKGGFYAVARGKKVGIFSNWDDCKAQVDGFPNARYKKFGSEAEALDFIKENSSYPTTTTSSVQNSAIPPSKFQVVKTSGAKSTRTAPASVREDEFHPQVSTFKRRQTSLSKLPALTLTDDEFEAQNKRAAEVLKRAGFAVSTSPSPSSSVTSSTFKSSMQKRSFSTTKVLDKRKLKVTEEVVVNKRQKTNDGNVGVSLANFAIDDAGYVVVFTDGACSKNGNKGAKAGIGVWFKDGHFLNVSEPVRGRQTNNTAEIQAAEKAISQAKEYGINKLNVQTDSQFVINCITKWINKWKRNGWKLADGKPVINRTDLEKLDAAMTNMDVKWSYVAGHRGHYGNEAADRLAVEGANRA